MHLMIYPDEKTGDRYAFASTCCGTHTHTHTRRVYTLKKVTPAGAPTQSAHPARFSPDDKFSRQRVTIKKKFGVLMTDFPQKQL